MKLVFISAACALSVYAALLIFARLFSNALMFHPPARTYSKTPEHTAFKMHDGMELTAVFLKSSNPGAPKVFYCHGNGEDLGMIYPVLNELRRRGFSVFSYDYPGYGYSYGKASPTEENLYESAQAAWKCASEKFGFTPENTVLMGFSLGSAAVCSLSEKYSGWRGMVLAGGISNGVKTILPVDIIPWKILDNSSKVSKIGCPLLLLHGTLDFIVAPRNARENFNAAKHPKKLVWLEGFHHNDIVSSPEFWSETVSFIENPKKP